MSTTKGIFFYSKRGCKYCQMLESEFRTSNIEYVKYEVKNNEEATRIKDKTGRNTFPILFINGNLVGGYSEYRTLTMTNQFACNDF